MTSPIQIDKGTLSTVLRWIGSPLILIVILIVARPYWDADHSKVKSDAIRSNDWPALETKLEAHGRQMSADQRADEARDEILESLLREGVDQQRAANVINRELLRIQKCAIAAKNDDSRRACVGVVR